jgi:putative peptidoglycan lipid II flippase
VTRQQAVRGVAGAAALIAVLTVLSRVAGFGRTLVFTNTVGADTTGDAYVAANNVPNIVFEVVAGGALASLVVPMLAGGIAAGDREQVRATASALLGWALLVLTPLAVALALLARPIAEALLGDQAADPGKVDVAARFLVVFAPQVVLYGIAVVLTGVLQAHRRFAGPALAPLLSSVVVAGAYLTFAGIGGGRDVRDLSRPAELVLGVGTTLGVLALAACLLVPMRGLRLGLRPRLRFPVGAAPRVRRLALAGVITLAGQQLVAVVAIRLTNDAAAPDGTNVVYFAGMTLFLLPWAALAVPLATSAYPGLSERAAVGDEPGYRAALAPVVVLVVAVSALAAAGLVAVSGPMARVFLASSADAARAEALAPTIVAFVPGLLGYGLVAVLTRALYARGLWRSPTVCVGGGWLVAVAADLLLAAALPAADRATALALGHTIGVSVAGIGLLVVVRRVLGPTALAGLGRVGSVAVVAGVLGAAAGLAVSHALGSDPVPSGGVLAAIGIGVVAGAVVLVVAGAVMMVGARGPLRAAVAGLRGPARAADGSADRPADGAPGATATPTTGEAAR